MKQSIYPDLFITDHCPQHVDICQLPTADDIIKKETADYGVGIFAQRPFMRGETIGQFVAEATSEVLQHTLQRRPQDHLHDPYFIGFLLHSCDPNVVLDMHAQKAFCVRDISAGSPLFMDYTSTEDQLFNQFACKCGAANCRHWVTGRNERVTLEGEQYLASLPYRIGSDIIVPDDFIHVASNLNHEIQMNDSLYCASL